MEKDALLGPLATKVRALDYEAEAGTRSDLRPHRLFPPKPRRRVIQLDLYDVLEVRRRADLTAGFFARLATD